ncbi:hypothetical protein BH09BAC5_BH09BAC5_14000 [soil metagenome]
MRHIFIFLFLFSAASANAQKFPACPKRVPLAGQQLNKSIQDRSDYELYNTPIITSFHPIGWSADGKAAYLTWSEGETGAKMGVIIFDAETNSIADSWFDNFGGEKYLTAEQVELLWKGDKDSILPLLNQYKIVSDTGKLYSDFPFSTGTKEEKKDFTMEYYSHKLAADNRFDDSLFLMCGVRYKNNTDSIRMRIGGYHALYAFPTGLWLSPDKKHGLLLIVICNGKQQGDDPPHTLEFETIAIKFPE